jgi:hypothetical protein
MVAGELVLDHGRFTHVDEDEIGRRLAAVAARGTSTDEAAFAALMHALRPHIDAHYKDWPDITGQPYHMVNSRD